MNTADRIQNLRKAKGVSQEELADRLGVSRQAVSKWESEQSVPDLDKIILMSDYFGVTTDYLLKGIEPTDARDKRPDAGIFAIVATALNFIGLVVAAAVWHAEQTAAATVIGLVFMALGCMVYGIGMLEAASATKKKTKRAFWTVNVWLLSFIPLSFIYNALFSGYSAPYPIPAQPLIAYPAFWAAYIALCLCVGFIVRKREG